MENDNIAINEDALYTLKVDSNGRFYTEFIIIDKSLLEIVNIISLYKTINAKSWNDLSEFERSKLNKAVEGQFGDLKGSKLEEAQLFFVKKQLILEFYSDLYQNHNEVYGYRDFCSRYALTSSYCQFRSVLTDKNFDIQISSYGIYIKSSENDSLHLFESFTTDFFHSFFIQNAYQLCKEDNKIKVYSHRNVGWRRYNYQLNETLSIDISTNFCYGYASYFAVTLVFLGIRIIPYSRLVLYQYANVAQILRYTREYRVLDISWKYAIDFVRDASNDFLINGKESFVAEYMVKECETLIQLLPQYLVTDEFNLSENTHGFFFEENKNFRKVKLEGYLLIIFRAEKVTGAINFYSSIQELSVLFPVEKYLNCIKNCSLQIMPQLNIAIEELDKLLLTIKKQIDIEKELLNLLKLESEEKKKLQNKYDNYELEFREMLFEENKELPEVYSSNSPYIIEQALAKMDKIYPEHNTIKQNYNESIRVLEEQNNVCNELDNQYKKNQDFRTQIDEFNSNIKIFIDTIRY